MHVFPNQCHELRGGDSKKKDSYARVNEAKIEPGGKQEHNLIRTEKLIIRPFCRVDDKLAKVKKRCVKGSIGLKTTLCVSVLSPTSLISEWFLRT
jgi:hypothetical protein